MPLLAVPGKSAVAGLFEFGLSCFTTSFSSSLVFVVGGDVVDAGMQSDLIPELAGDGKFGAQGGRVFDREQVRKLGLEVSVEAFDPGLIGSGLPGGRSVGRSRTAPGIPAWTPMSSVGRCRTLRAGSAGLCRRCPGGRARRRVGEPGLDLSGGFFDGDRLGDPLA